MKLKKIKFKLKIEHINKIMLKKIYIYFEL